VVGRTAVSLLIGATMLTLCAGAESPGVQWREQALAGVCTLRLAVPPGWTAEVKAQGKDKADFRFSSADGSRGGVLLKVLPVDSTTGLRNEEQMRQKTQAGCEKLLGGTADKQAKLLRIQGTAGAGYLCRVTNANPKPPDSALRYLTLGYMAVGRARLSVAVMADAPRSSALRAATAMLSTAECDPDPPAPAK
jgi:hypothetical protein